MGPFVVVRPALKVRKNVFNVKKRENLSLSLIAVPLHYLRNLPREIYNSTSFVFVTQFWKFHDSQREMNIWKVLRLLKHNGKVEILKIKAWMGERTLGVVLMLNCDISSCRVGMPEQAGPRNRLSIMSISSMTSNVIWSLDGERIATTLLLTPFDQEPGRAGDCTFNYRQPLK